MTPSDYALGDRHGRGDQDGVLVAALVSGLSYVEAGDIAGCSKSTVARRMRESEFRGAGEEGRREFADMLSGRLLQAQPAAVTVLAELMATATSEGDRIRAARALLQVRRTELVPMDVRDIRRLVNEVLDVALRYVPEENEELLLRELRAITV
jgi:hypothetical protein